MGLDPRNYCASVGGCVPKMPQMRCMDLKFSTTERLCRLLLVLTLLASARGQETVGTALVVSTGQPGFVTDLTYSKSGEFLITGSAGTATAVLWAARSGLKIREFHCGAGSAI